jgi:hypothetical protein
VVLVGVVVPHKSLGNLGNLGTCEKPQATKQVTTWVTTWVMLAWQLKESIGEEMQLRQLRQLMPFCCLVFVSGCICPFFPKRIHLLHRIPPFVS